MQAYLDILKKCPLFNNIPEKELLINIKSINYQIRSYNNNEYVLSIGDYTSLIGIVLSGNVYISEEDIWGNTSIISNIDIGDIFGETYACLDNYPLQINVKASENTKILFISTNEITNNTLKQDFAYKFLTNLLQAIAHKNLLLTQKIKHISKRTTRDKLLSYLNSQAQKSDRLKFNIPFNRQQLADYLSLDRSSMSRELGKMQAEGIIIVNKNTFELLSK